MKAMILAAGLGTRLQPLTNDRPKALVEVGGRTLLEITLRRLRSFGIRTVIVNAHHFADLIVEYLEANDLFGMRIEISRERDLLDTGGGLQKAADFFLRDAALRDEPFVLHNVDVLSSIDLGEMVKYHRAHGGLATLALRQRESSRQLLFDERLQLCGRRVAEAAEPEMVRPAWETQELAFSGIHVVSTRIFSLMNHALTHNAFGHKSFTNPDGMPEAGKREEHVFPIIPMYLHLAGAGEKITGYRTESAYWRDLGTLASLQQAAEDVARKVIEL